MFVTPAFAQAAGGPGAVDLFSSFVPILLLIVIFWLLIFRPQQKRAKEHQAMLNAIRRGDTVVTTGGIIGKVIRVKEGEDLEIEIADGVRVKLARGMVTDVRSKAEPVNDNK
ncbi:MAG TPA: preprotein translocase subunit YajC [Devosiaceae bacterium]